MSSISFDRISGELLKQNERRWAIAACCAACAQRLFPEFINYCNSLAPALEEGERAARNALEFIWECISAQKSPETMLREILAECERQLLSEDAAAAAGHPYAEDAIASIVFCIRFIISGEVMNAVWCLQRSYGVLDNFVIEKYGFDISTSVGEGQVLSSNEVQRELGRQLRDLSSALKASEAGVLDFERQCSILRGCAIEEGERYFL